MGGSETEGKQINKLGVTIRILIIVCILGILVVVGLALLLWFIYGNADKIDKFIPCYMMCDE